jgi:hypothetical protein
MPELMRADEPNVNSSFREVWGANVSITTNKLQATLEESMVREGLVVRLSLFSVAVLLSCFAVPAAHAATIVVGTCKSGIQFSTIQAAVNAAPNGATVDVCPNTYPEQVTITKALKLMAIQSGTADAPVVVPPGGGLTQNGTDIFGDPVAAQIFVASTSGNVTIKGITVDATGNNLTGCGAPTLTGIYFQNTSGTISDNTTRNQYQTDFADFGGCQNGLAINVESLTSSVSVTVSDNSVRAYQKNGITATGAATGTGAPGPNVTINGNNIVGLAATSMNWPVSGAAENGIQIGFGARGSVSSNIVNDNIWGQDQFGDTGDAASGILIYASQGVSVTSNYIGSAQFPIVTVSDNFTGYGLADNTTITSNKVSGTQLYDAIDLCSNHNTVRSNMLFGSSESGIHIDDTCSGNGNLTGNNNTVTNNTINEACAGILTGTGTTGNTISPDTFFNVTNTTQAGDTCTAPPTGAKQGAGKRAALRPAPYNPVKRK